MTFLPQDTQLGLLKLVEVYVYSDRPCLFSCLNDEGQYFLVLWINETSESDCWQYALVSKAVLNIMQAPDFNFRSVFQNTAGGSVFEVEAFNDGRSTATRTLNCCDLGDESLPV